MRPMKTFVLMLSAPALLGGCSNTIVVTADKLCADWRHASVSKDDKMTDATASQIEASNKSRPAWGCEYGKNKARG